MGTPNLVEKAADAPSMMRVLFDTMHKSLVGEHPQLARPDVWPAFHRMACIAGCVGLSMRLHFDVRDQLRTPAELGMRQALDRAVPGGENQYEDCTQFVRASLMEFDRPSRPNVAFYLLAMWVVSKVFEDEPMAEHQGLLAVTAALFECETAGYWATALDDARLTDQAPPVTGRASKLQPGRLLFWISIPVGIVVQWLLTRQSDSSQAQIISELTRNSISVFIFAVVGACVLGIIIADRNKYGEALGSLLGVVASVLITNQWLVV